MNNQRYLKKLRDTQLEILDYVVTICEKNNLKYSLIGGTLLGAIRHDGYIPWDDDIDICMPRKDYEKFKKIFPRNEKFILDDYSTNKNYWLPFIKIRNIKTCYKENIQEKYSGNSGIWIDIFPLDNGNKKISTIEKVQFIFTGIIRTAIAKKSKMVVGNDKRSKKILINIFIILPKKLLIKIQHKLMVLNKNEESEYLLNLGSQYGYKKQIHLRKNFFPCKKHLFENRYYYIPKNSDYVLKNIYGNNYMQLPPIEKRVTHNPIEVTFEDGENIKFDKKNNKF